MTGRPYIDEDAFPTLRRPDPRPRDERASTGEGGGLKALYTVPEFAEMCRVHRNTMRRLLQKAGVQFVGQGRGCKVPLSEIRTKLPEVYASFMLAHGQSDAEDFGAM